MLDYFVTEIAIVSYEPDDAVKEKKMITLTQEVIPFYLTKMNVVAKENGGHLVLNRVSLASQHADQLT
jgi:glutathione S-transferase